jgi:hypothetical protein
MKKIVCTFANYPLSNGFERYRKEAENMEIFDEIYTYNENDLNRNFRKKYGRFLYPYSRGYGYWGWKPIIIKETFDKMQLGDILLYTDLGCFFNIEGKKRLSAYFEIVNQSETGILGFRPQIVSKDNRIESKFYEYEYTKGDIFDYFNVREDKNYTDTIQFEATVIFIKKNAVTESFINEWTEVINNHFDLITDKPSKSSNLRGFRDNRHDQSIYSILAKKYKIDEVSRNELCPNEFDNYDWTIMKDYPIWAKREVFYPSMWHYNNRFRLRSFNNAIWGVKYFFKSLLHPKAYHR